MSLSLFSLPLPAITRNSLKRSVGSAETSLKAAHKNPFLSGNSCWWQVKGEKMPHAAFFFSVWYSQDRHPRLKAEEEEVEEEEVTTGTGRPHVVPCLARLRYFVRWRFKKKIPLRGKSHSQRLCARVGACWRVCSSCVRESTRYVLDWVPLVVIMYTSRRRRRRRRGRAQAAPMRAG